MAREDFFGVLLTARGHGRALAERHLREGHDVVLPQLVTSHDRGLGFDEVAQAAGASYIEGALGVDEEAHLQRLREKRPVKEVEARIQDLLVDPDSDLVERTREHFARYLADRPQAIGLDTTGLTEDETYALLLDTIDQAAGPSRG